MSTSELTIDFADNRRTFEPGDRLRATCSIDPPPETSITSYKWSAFWRTEGKGDSDSDVITSTDNDSQEAAGSVASPRNSPTFEIELPLSPLTYDGLILKIRWFVAVRVELDGADALEGEAEFQLGGVIPSTEVKK
jgi:hypothetical protein